MRPSTILLSFRYTYAKDTFDLSPGFTLVDSIVNLTTVPQKVTFVAYPYLRGPGSIRRCPGIPAYDYYLGCPDAACDG